MSKKISVGIALTITIIAMTVTFVVTFLMAMRRFDNTVTSLFQKQVLNNKIAEIDRYARGNYFGDIDDTYLGDRVARGYMDGLRDSDSVYYTEREYTEILEIENGTRVNVGLELVRDANNYFYIAKVHAGSPAANQGVTPGGYIVEVDGVDARNYTSVRTLQSALRGTTGTVLNIVCRYGAEGDKDFAIQRINYSAPTVEPLQMMDGIAYIRVTDISSTTYAEFDSTIREAILEDAKGFVFDLRGVTSNNYDEACKMIDLVCPLGTIVTARYKTGTTKALHTSDEETISTRPMVVVVNGNTAAAAELFALSVRNLADGQIVGVHTAGKGTLQLAPFRLTDGSAIVVTTAQLHPSRAKGDAADASYGETWDAVGIEPEITVLPTSDDALALYNINVSTDPQIVRAAQVARSLALAQGLDVSQPVATSEPENIEPTEPPTGEEEGAGESENDGENSEDAGGDDDTGEGEPDSDADAA